MCLGGAGRLGMTSQFVEANGDGLAEIHGDIVFAGGNVQQPVTMAEIRVGEAALLGAKQEGDGGRGQAAADQASAVLEPFEGMTESAAADGGGADDQGAIGDGVGQGGEFAGVGQDLCATGGGAGLAEGGRVGLDDAQMRKAEIAHGAGGRAEIEGIARGHQDDTQAFGLRRGQQNGLFYDETEAVPPSNIGWRRMLARGTGGLQ